MTLYARCRINRCHYNWVQLHMPRADTVDFKDVHIGLVVNEVAMEQTFSKHSLSPASYQARDSLKAGRSGDRILVDARFSTPVRTSPWGPPSLQYNGNQVFPGGKAARADADYPSPTSTKVKERVDLYLYSPSGPS